MKRIIALLLVLVMAFCLIGCNEDLRDQILDHRNQYDYVPEVVDEITLDVYIICDLSTQSARDAVTRQINIYTEDKFKTKLNINYVASSDYETTVMENLDTADLILVTSKAMMDTLVAEEKVADLTEFFSSEKYGSLNVDIAEALLEASKYAYIQDEETGATQDVYYAVPNNRVLGTYTYLCINKQSVHHEMMYPLSSIEEYPYVFSLDMANSEEGVARLVRSLILRDMVADKDADALAAAQKTVFQELVVDKFLNSYLIDQNLNNGIDSIASFIELLTEEQLALVQDSFDTAIADMLTKRTEYGNSNDPITIEARDQLTKLLGKAKEVYSKYHFNYGVEDPENPADPPLKPYPVAADLIAWYLEVRTTVDSASRVLGKDDLFTAEELELLFDYKNNCSTYLEAIKEDTIDMSAYEAYDAVLLSGAMYEDKAAIEAAGWVCNVVEAPVVDAEEAFTSAFAVVQHEDVSADRVMEIIYAFNTDVYLHNLLLYGVENINFNLTDGHVTLYGDDYRMNPLYTGDLFISYYCEELAYTKEAAEYGEKQNKDAIAIVVPLEKPEADPVPAE